MFWFKLISRLLLVITHLTAISTQGGNVMEWNEDRAIAYRGLRGGGYTNKLGILAASFRFGTYPQSEASNAGFRVAMIPEPSTGLLVMAGMLGLAAWRKRKAL